MYHMVLVLLACKSRLVADHRYLLSGVALSMYSMWTWLWMGDLQNHAVAHGSSLRVTHVDVCDNA